MSSKHKVTDRNSNLKSTRMTTPFQKLARNLNDDFEQYVLKEKDEEIYEEEDNQEEEYERQDQNKYKQQQRMQQDTSYHTRPLRVSSKLGQSANKQRSNSKQRPKPYPINQQNINSMNQITTIPKSYLLAMQHLQKVVQAKNEEIDELKSKLIQKQQIILECQSRINETLLKFHTLMDMFTTKENQITILKQQMEELRYDKQIALKQAAKAIQIEFKPDLRPIPVPIPIIQPPPFEFNTFKQRSMSVNGFSRPQPSQTYMNFGSKDLGSYQPRQSMKGSRQSYAEDKTSEMLITNKLQLDSGSKYALISHKSKDRDFISYQRQIIRNEKQLVALKYRMQCLQRKLTTDPKEPNVKQKIKKLSQEIEIKERTLNDLKKL